MAAEHEGSGPARMGDGRRALVLIGPSGSGKSSVVRALQSRGVVRVHPTWTTRSRRADEVDGSVEHRFVSHPKFERLAANGFFLHTVQLFGLADWYGLPPIEWSGDGVVDAVMLRAPLVARFAQDYPDHVVYQVEASRDVMVERLGARGYGPDELRARLADNERECVAGHALAFRRFRNDGALAVVVDEVAAAVADDFATASQVTS